MNKLTICFKGGATKEVIASDDEVEVIWGMLNAVFTYPDNKSDHIFTDICDGKGKLAILGRDITGLFQEPI